MVGKADEQVHESGLASIEIMDAPPFAAWAARKALRRLCAAGSAGATAPPRLSSDVIFELVLCQLETNEQFEAGALHRRLDLGQAQRVDRRVGIPGLALARAAEIGRAHV